MMPTPESLGYAFLGGILPALLWLYFLLKEDARCPEPRSMIIVAFFAGMFAVPLVIPLESFFKDYAMIAFPACMDGAKTCSHIIVAWAAIEETFKYGLAAFFVLSRKAVNESVDLVIYMITVALGFAALENTLFLITPFSQGHFLVGLETDNLRFVGSTLLHVIASSAIGFALAFSYKAKPVIRVLAGGCGLILAIALHAFFNFFIIQGDGAHTFLAFSLVWIGTVVFFGLFEVLKYFQYRHLPKNVCEV